MVSQNDEFASELCSCPDLRHEALTRIKAVKKIVIDRPGGHHRLQIKESPTPTPQNHEVLIDVSAAGVNFADVFIRLVSTNQPKSS